MTQTIMSLTAEEIPDLPPEPEPLIIIRDDIEPRAPAERHPIIEAVPEDVIYLWKAELYEQALSPEREAEIMGRESWPEGFSPIALRTLRAGMETLHLWGVDQKTASRLIAQRYGRPELYNTRPDGTPAHYKVPNLAEDYLKAIEWMKTTYELIS